MMPSCSSSHTGAGNDGNDGDQVTTATSIQWLPLIMCHEAAVTLNNYIVTTLLWRDRDIRAASATCRDAIYLIKKCTTPFSTSGTTETSDIMNRISPDEIRDIVQHAYQRAALGPVEAASHPDVLPVSSMEVQEESGSFQNETDRRVRIQVISNCVPCSNVVIPSRYTTTTTTTNAPVITPTVRMISATSDVSILPNASNHSIVSASTVSSHSSNHSSHSDSHPTTAPIAPSLVPRPSSTPNEATTPAGSTLLLDETLDDDRRIPMSVYPMTIDDFHMRCTRPELNGDDDDDEDARLEQHQQLVEYHAAILLYNFGIIHQCLGMMMDHDADMILDSNETNDHATTTSDNNTSPTGNHHTNDDHYDHHNDDGESAGQLIASYKILTNTLSWVHELVQPILDHVVNEDHDDSLFNTNGTEIPMSIATLPIDYYYMNKYLHVMVLINHHVVSIIDTLHFPGGSHDYFCQMMNEILNFISYLDIFFPMTSQDPSHRTGGGGGGTDIGGSASPAA